VRRMPTQPTVPERVVLAPSADTIPPCPFDNVGDGDRILVLPRPDHAPSYLAQALVGLTVSRDITIELGAPPVGICLGSYGVLRTAVPEASVNEDGNQRSCEGDIGTTRKAGDVHSVAEPSTVKLAAESTLRLGARRPQVGHEPADCRTRRWGLGWNG
jgi:hypothetical protein